ncbi:MFS transporter [Streptomyces albogriseolus]|uniref:MFS family permease n=1 Tax=Streptomyces albogriseolus TaxID=1887 RepID=A0ACC6UI81_STRAO|nr:MULTISPECIES: MFS transporter [Streptomyces]GHC11713.1 MFS transporter [Streptomyces albogriseolus]MCX4619183.1 MFS transporter [Streptomyces viridodiastaticus]NIL51656.1 MFS transporter [Streptomyces sp. 2BBP-J2]WPP28904.1 MFS transporter [Streptomyces sp. CL7]GHG10375.1 MFS transporter [Streptomyces viridodiastaticus]
MATGYLDILRARHATRLLVGTLIGRLPNATAPIAIVLFVRAEGGSYSLAGVLAAVYGLSNAVGQPVLGRLVDLKGQPRVQLPAALLSALAMAVFAFTGTGSLVVAYGAVALAGLFTPPLEGGLRALWSSVLPKEEHVHRAYALDAVAQEVMFAVGPLLVTVCTSLWSAQAALLVLNVIGVLGALSVVVSPPSRAWRSAPREAHWLGALRSPGLIALLGAFLAVGMALGSITVAAVTYADDHGGDAVYGWLMAGIGLGALVGGIAYGARQWAGEPARRLQVIVALLAVFYLPLMLMPGPVAMTLLTVVAGVFLAPAIACAFVLVDRHAPRGTVTEAFSWLVTTFTVGASLGTGVTGPVVEAGGALWGFAVPGAAGGVSLLVLTATGRVLAVPARTAVVAAGSENDPNRAVEPRFSSKDRA